MSCCVFVNRNHTMLVIDCFIPRKNCSFGKTTSLCTFDMWTINSGSGPNCICASRHHLQRLRCPIDNLRTIHSHYRPAELLSQTWSETILDTEHASLVLVHSLVLEHNLQRVESPLCPFVHQISWQWSMQVRSPVHYRIKEFVRQYAQSYPYLQMVGYVDSCQICWPFVIIF